jgi:insertion element IS1 protein InsB
MAVGFAIQPVSYGSVLRQSLTPLKKESSLQHVNASLLQGINTEQVQVIVHKVEAAEVDEMWSFVGSKNQQRWLWHAIDHYTGQVLAFITGHFLDH